MLRTCAWIVYDSRVHIYDCLSRHNVYLPLTSILCSHVRDGHMFARLLRAPPLFHSAYRYVPIPERSEPSSSHHKSSFPASRAAPTSCSPHFSMHILQSRTQHTAHRAMSLFCGAEKHIRREFGAMERRVTDFAHWTNKQQTILGWARCVSVCVCLGAHAKYSPPYDYI